MRHITILGAGLLIGTALAVIIPEGIHTLYSVSESKISETDHLSLKNGYFKCLFFT
jgi:solute carrier family 39 (zinc transporter), member 9